MKNSALAGVWDRWREQVVLFRKQRGTLERILTPRRPAFHRIVTKEGLRWLDWFSKDLFCGILVSSWQRWRDHTNEAKQLFQAAQKEMSGLTKGALVRPFERWRDHMIDEKHMKRKSLTVVRRVMNGALVTSFERWRDHMIEEKHMKSNACRQCEMDRIKFLIQISESEKQALRASLQGSQTEIQKVRRSSLECSHKVKRCLKLSKMIRNRVLDSVFKAETTVLSESISSFKSTVGIMFTSHGEVENLMVGGPAYLSRKVLRGDFIIEVDGKPVYSWNLSSAIIGDDLPGSILTLKLRRGENSFTVTLKRISTAEVVHIRRMFDLFTGLLDKAMKDKDEEAVHSIQDTFLCWETMMNAELEKHGQIVENVKRMQDDCTSYTEEISSLLRDIYAKQDRQNSPADASSPECSGEDEYVGQRRRIKQSHNSRRTSLSMLDDSTQRHSLHPLQPPSDPAYVTIKLPDPG